MTDKTNPTHAEQRQPQAADPRRMLEAMTPTGLHAELGKLYAANQEQMRQSLQAAITLQDASKQNEALRGQVEQLQAQLREALAEGDAEDGDEPPEEPTH
jgi:cell division protein FtsB